MNQSLSDKVFKNTLFNSLGTIWGGLLTFIITPYIVYRLGTDRFGLLSIVGVITGYLGLMDFSFGSAYIRYIAHFHSRNDHLSINQLAVAGILFYTFLSFIILITVMVFMPSLLNILNVPGYLADEASFILLLGVGLLAFNSIMSIFPSVVNGLQRMDITNTISILLSIPAALGTVFVLEKGLGLKGLMINNAIFQALNALVMVFFSYRLLPSLKINLTYFKYSVLVQLLSFGTKLHIARISGLVTMQIDKIFITYFLAIGLVTYYQLANSIIIYALTSAGLMVSALLPAFSELEGRGDRATLISSYLQGTKYLAFFAIPFFCFIGISASSIMKIWMGSGYELSIAIIQILSAGWMVNMVAQVGASVCIAMDRPQIMALGSLINLSLNIILNIIFIKSYGFSGVAWGTSIAVIVGTLYFQMMLHRELRIPVSRLIKTLMPFLISSIISSIIIIVVNYVVVNIHFVINRLGELLFLCINGSIFAGTYIVSIKIGRVFSYAEMNYFRTKIPLLSSILSTRGTL